VTQKKVTNCNFFAFIFENIRKNKLSRVRDDLKFANMPSLKAFWRGCVSRQPRSVSAGASKKLLGRDG